MSDALFDIIAHYGAGNVDVVVHSMGNQLFFEILQGCDPAKPEPGSDHPIRNLILSAPDVGVPNFETSVEVYQEHASRTFIYGTDRDLILAVSRQLNKDIGDDFGAEHPRLGWFARGHVDAPRIDWINTVTVDNRSPDAPANHSHYVNTPAVRKDIAMILNGFTDEGPVRCVLPTHAGERFFYISPNCL